MKPLRNEFPNNRRKRIKLFLPKLSLFWKAFNWEVSSTFCSKWFSFSTWRRQGPSQTHPKASNLPVTKVPPLSSTAVAEPPALDTIFSTELLICPPSQPFAKSLLAYCLSMSERLFLPTIPLFLSHTLACHQGTIAKTHTHAHTHQVAIHLWFSLDF